MLKNAISVISAILLSSTVSFGQTVSYIGPDGSSQRVDANHPLPTTATQGAAGTSPWQVAVGKDWFYAQAITVSNTSHANNTCIGALQSITVSEAVASNGIILNNFAVRSAGGLTGSVGMYIFTSQPSSLCANDGDAFALTDANYLLVPPAGAFSLTPAAMPGGATQTGAANTLMQISMKVDASKKFYFAIVNTSGGAITPAANSFSVAANGFTDPN